MALISGKSFIPQDIQAHSITEPPYVPIKICEERKIEYGSVIIFLNEI